MKATKTSFVRIETAARNRLRAYCRKNKAVMGVVASRIIYDFTEFHASREKQPKTKRPKK